MSMESQIEEYLTGNSTLVSSILPSHVWIRAQSREQIRRRLRISLVEHCNMACFFCHNEGQGPIGRAPSAALPASHIESIVRVAVENGADKIKLSGGEPLLYRHGDDDIVSLVKRLDELRVTREFDLSVTTNGTLLPAYAERLRAAGLDRATISIGTLNPQTFQALMAPNARLLDRAVSGLAAARLADLAPLKLNATVYYSAERRLGNLHELAALTELAMAHQVSELRIFTLLAHRDFADFSEFYQFFSVDMQRELERLFRHFGVENPRDTVKMLTVLGTVFANHLYPKVEFGVSLGSMRIAFEAMKYGRLQREANGLQEGPYAMRLGANGALRSTLDAAPSFRLICAVEQGADAEKLAAIYRSELDKMP